MAGLIKAALACITRPCRHSPHQRTARGLKAPGSSQCSPPAPGIPRAVRWSTRSASAVSTPMSCSRRPMTAARRCLNRWCRFSRWLPTARRTSTRTPRRGHRAAGSCPPPDPCRRSAVSPDGMGARRTQAQDGASDCCQGPEVDRRHEIWFSPSRCSAALDRSRFMFPGFEHRGTGELTGEESVVDHAIGLLQAGRRQARRLRAAGIVPAALAGHSMGEWTAMVVAGSTRRSTSSSSRCGPAWWLSRCRLRGPGLLGSQSTGSVWQTKTR